MSPAQAAQAAGVSRWSVMRAIKSQHLRAIRGNRNEWMIAPDDLAEWCSAHGAHAVRASAAAHPFSPPDRQANVRLSSLSEVAELRDRLSASEARAAALEVDRDGLREKLAAADLRAAVVDGDLRASQARADAAERARDQAEAECDRWRQQAETLAASRRWRFWPWR